MATFRREVLGHYLDYLPDPLVLHTDPAVERFLAMPESFRPLGFRDWRVFGAPKGAPGQAAHHPAKKEHEVLAWVLGMHFLSALELVAWSDDNDGNELLCDEEETSLRRAVDGLPPPFSTNETDVSALFGYEDDRSHSWKMIKLECRTTFEPVLSGRLSEVVVSGMAPAHHQQGYYILPKGMSDYHPGWVLDWSESERTAKRKLERYEGGLGFLDSKPAYFGIYRSRTLRMELPLVRGRSGEKASGLLESVLVCQVNEKKRHPDACQADSQMQYIVGGAIATEVRLLDSAGTLYLGHKLCVRVSIPADGVLEGDRLVSLEVSVNDTHIAHIETACSVSHVVWEEKA